MLKTEVRRSLALISKKYKVGLPGSYKLHKHVNRDNMYPSRCLIFRSLIKISYLYPKMRISFNTSLSVFSYHIGIGAISFLYPFFLITRHTVSWTPSFHFLSWRAACLPSTDRYSCTLPTLEPCQALF